MTNNRNLNVTGGLNFRELGGYPTLDNQTVKWHKLLRTAGLAGLTPEDQQHLSQYGVVADVDFRSKDEQTMAPDRVPVGATYHFYPFSQLTIRPMLRQQKPNSSSASTAMTKRVIVTW